MSLRTLKWLTVFIPVATLAVFDYLRHFVFSSLHHMPDALFVDLLVLLAAFLFSHTVFNIISRKEMEIRRLYEREERRSVQLRSLHQASLALTEELSSTHLLQKTLDSSRDLIDARYGALAVLDEERHVHRFLTSGLSTEEARQVGVFPEGRGLLTALFHEGRPVRVGDVGKAPQFTGILPPGHPSLSSLLGVPIRSQGRIVGALYLSERNDGQPFSREDEELLDMFAAQAGIAIENARLYQQVQDMAVVTERERLAREMHDGLAQVLSYVNTKAQAVETFLARGQVEAAQSHMGQLAKAARETYADVREAILGLRTVGDVSQGLVTMLREYVEQFAQLGLLKVHLEVAPEVESLSFSPAAELQLVRIVQEALTNVRKHARAQQAHIWLAREDDSVTVGVEDDGTGFDPQRPVRSERPHFGLKIMQERAESIGGHLEIVTAPDQGTRVVVCVPLPVESDGWPEEH